MGLFVLLAEPVCGTHQVGFRDGANARDLARREFAHAFLDRIESSRVLGDEVGVDQSIPEQHVQHAVEQCHVGTGRQRQEQVGDLSRVGAARVGDDDAQARVCTLGFLDPAKQHGVRIGRVGAHQEQGARMIDIFVARRRRVGAQRELVAGHGAAHAKARIGIDVVGPEQAFREFVEDVVILGQELPGDVETKAVRTMFPRNSHHAVGGEVQCVVPRQRLRRLAPLRAPHRPKQARLHRDRLGRGQMQRVALGTEAPKVGRVLGIATNADNPIARRFDHDAASNPAIAAGRVCVLHRRYERRLAGGGAHGPGCADAVSASIWARFKCTTRIVESSLEFSLER